MRELPERAAERATSAAGGQAARALVLFGVLVSAAIVSVTGYEIASQRQAIFEHSRRQVASLAIALSEQVERVVASADFAVSDIDSELAAEYDAGRAPVAAELQKLLRNHAVGLPGVRSLVFADAAGNLVAHSRHAGRLEGLSIADRPYFQALRASAAQGLLIGKPIVGRVTGRPHITLSRAVVDGAGRFRGIVIAGVETAYFSDFFAQVLNFEGGSAALLRTDGTPLARYPAAAGGTAGATAALDRGIRLGPADPFAGIFRDVDADSRRPRLIGYRKVDDQPLLVAIALDEETLLAGWRATAWRLGATGAFGFAVVWLLLGAILRLMRNEAAQAERLARSEQQFRAVVERASDALFLHDLDGRIVMINQSACDSLGYASEELVGRHIGNFVPDADSGKLSPLWRSAGDGRSVTLETEHRRKDGATFPVEVRLGAFDMNGRRLILALARDISERKAYQHRLEQQANYDMLTGLPNRLLFIDRLHTALAAARRSQRPLALLFIDLDGFKNINDTLGHAAGDALLAESGRRISRVLREADTVARYGGDEFVVLLPELDEAADGSRVAEKIRDAFVAPFDLGGRPVIVRPSVGVALHPGDGDDAESLLHRADTDMYLAKGGARMKDA